MGIHADDTHTAETMAPEFSSAIPGWRQGIPLVRILSCGPFTIEILHEVLGGDAAQACYAPLPPECLHGRGPAPALTFLKLLISQPDRNAPKDWLIEHIRQDECTITPKRLENIVSFGHRFLDLPDSTRPPGMLRYVRVSQESGDGYRLLPQWEGKTYLDLAQHSPERGYYQQAFEAFTCSAALQPVGDLSTSEAMFNQAEAARGLDDLACSVTCLREGALKGLSAGSQKRYREASAIFRSPPKMVAGKTDQGGSCGSVSPVH